MLNKKHQILEEFVKRAWKKFTFQEIKKLSGKKSESYVYTSLKKFVKSNILKEERAGNVVLYSFSRFFVILCGDSKNMMVRFSSFKLFSKVSFPFFFGKNPRKRKSSVGKPQTESIVVTELTPGIGIISTLKPFNFFFHNSHSK